MITKKRGNFEFSWGEQHSMISIELWLKSYPHFRDVIANENKSVFMRVKKGMVHTYNLKKDFEGAFDVGKKLVEKGFLDRHLSVSRFVRTRFKSLFKEISKVNLKTLSNLKLSNYLHLQRELREQIFAFFKVSQPEYLKFAEKILKKLLEKNFDQKEQMVSAFITLTTPTEFDIIKEERIAALKLSFNKILTEKNLLDYSQKFPWLFFNTYDKSLVIKFLKEKFSGLQKIPIVERKKELESIYKELEEHKQKIQEVLSMIQYDQEEVERLSNVFCSLAVDRLKLKAWWGGVDYLFLGFFTEISNRVGIPVEDFLMTYSFNDMIDFLDTEKVLSQEEMNLRRNFYVLHLNKNSLNLLVGKDAHSLYLKHIGEHVKEKTKKEIKGTSASIGKVRGRARIIRVEGLNTLMKDMKQFQKGDIMVTTMTQPTMVPIARKAAAIVTNEGGITSHASIIAREFEIPCVVGTKVATKVIKDGDLIEVDGDKGIVKITKNKS